MANRTTPESIIFKHFKGKNFRVLSNPVKSIGIAYSNVSATLPVDTFTDGYYSHWGLVAWDTHDNVILISTTDDQSVHVHFIDTSTVKKTDEQHLQLKDTDNWYYIVNLEKVTKVKGHKTVGDIILKQFKIVKRNKYNMFGTNCQYYSAKIFNKYANKLKKINLISGFTNLAKTIYNEWMSKTQFLFNSKQGQPKPIQS